MNFLVTSTSADSVFNYYLSSNFKMYLDDALIQYYINEKEAINIIFNSFEKLKWEFRKNAPMWHLFNEYDLDLAKEIVELVVDQRTKLDVF